MPDLNKFKIEWNDSCHFLIKDTPYPVSSCLPVAPQPTVPTKVLDINLLELEKILNVMTKPHVSFKCMKNIIYVTELNYIIFEKMNT